MLHFGAFSYIVDKVYVHNPRFVHNSKYWQCMNFFPMLTETVAHVPLWLRNW